MLCGIYLLRFTGTDKVYIGQSKNITDRFSTHIRSFKDKIASTKLQNAYQEFGLPTLEILYECNIEDLDKNEEETIEIFNSVKSGFNTKYRNSGGYYRSIGKEAWNTRYSNEIIIKIFTLILEKIPNIEISKKLNVPTHLVSHIKCGRKHKWLQEVFKEKYFEEILSKNTKQPNKEKPIYNIKKPEYIGIQLVDKQGSIHTIDKSLSIFVKEHNLDFGAISKVISKQRNSHKGFSLLK